MIVYEHAPVLSCYYNREKRCLDLHAGFFFIFEFYTDIICVFWMDPLCRAIPTGLFYMHAISNVFFLNQHSCIIFFRIYFFFLCTVKIILSPHITRTRTHARTNSVRRAITIGMTCVSDIKDTFAQIYIIQCINGRMKPKKCYVSITWFTAKDK